METGVGAIPRSTARSCDRGSGACTITSLPGMIPGECFDSTLARLKGFVEAL